MSVCAALVGCAATTSPSDAGPIDGCESSVVAEPQCSELCADDVISEARALRFQYAGGGGGGIPGAVIVGDDPSSSIAPGSTRGDVKRLLGAVGDAVDSPFTRAYCASGLVIDYVRSPLRLADSLGRESDQVARIRSVGVRAATMDCALVVGLPWTATSLRGSAPATFYPARDGGDDFAYYEDVGLELARKNDVIESIAAYVGGTREPRGTALHLGPDALALGSLTIGSTHIEVANGELGGFTSIDSQLDVPTSAGDQTLKYRQYRQYGIQLAEPCHGPCSGLSTIVVTEPFHGVDAHGVGVGSERADVEAALGAPTGRDHEGVTPYGERIGVVYGRSRADCRERARAIVIGYERETFARVFAL